MSKKLMTGSFSMIGRAVMTPMKPVKNQPSDFTKFMIGGVLFSKDCPFGDTKDWDMLDCEVAITFTKHRKPAEFNKGNLGEMMTSMSEDDEWEKPTKETK